MVPFKTYLLLFLLVSCLCIQTVAQKNPYKEVSIASPTAASLGKYADIPVSYHTGIPQISIPIYTIKEGSLELPVSLNYHAGGLKVMEAASWVGAGWALNAGGVITRTVQGAPDERFTSSTNYHGYGHYSEYGYNSYYMIPNSNGASVEDWEHIASGEKDGEPDLFFFNFNGYSGKFYFRDDRTPVLVPEQDLRIEANYPGSGSIASFTITTPDGVKYHFGRTTDPGDVDPVEITNPYNADAGLIQGTAISSWYLNKIESADQQFAIRLTYLAENYGDYTISMYPVLNTNTATPSNPYTYEYRMVKNIISGVRLSKISFANGYLDFIGGSVRQDLSNTSINGFLPDHINTEAMSLGAIRLFQNNITECLKRFDFAYSYFEDNSNLTGFFANYNAIVSDRKRLKLNSIQESSCTEGISVPPHVFEYFTETVPRRLSFGQDHWGFINGVNSNVTLIPTYTENEVKTINGANRDAAWPSMRGGALQKIMYPTGGYSVFDFEPHQTWVSFMKKQWTNVFNNSLGYDGNYTSKSATQTLSAGTYKVSLTNTLGSGPNVMASININSGGTTVYSLAAEAGKTEQDVVTLPQGTYQIVLYKSNGVGTGNGASVYMELGNNIQVQENRMVGGLRIKSILANDGTGSPDMNTSYTYADGSKSTGILYSRPAYVQTIRNDLIKNVGYWNPSTGFMPSCSPNGCLACQGSSTVLPYFKSPNPIRPMETTQGNHIGYNEVKVAQAGNGHSIYRYYGSSLWDLNTDDVAYRNVNTADCNPNVPNYPAAPLPTDFMRGELKYEGHFTEAGQVVKDITYTPQYATSTAVSTPGFIVVGFQGQLLGTKYEMKTARKTQVKVEETVYTPGIGGQTTSQTTYFESPYHNQATRITTVNSKNETLETKIQYTLDFRVAGCDAISDCSTELNTANSNCLNQYNAARADCNGSSACLTNAYLAYLECQSQARVSYVNCRTTVNSDVENCKNAAIASADAILKPVLELQDQYQITPVETTQWKAGKLIKATFNQFAFTGPGVYLSKMQTLPLVSPSTTFTAAGVTNSTLVKDYRYRDELSFQYEEGNLVEQTTRGGTVTSYLWGYQRAFPVAKVTGASYNTIKAGLNASLVNTPSSDEALRNELNAIRNNVASALATTYTYNPIWGVSSETDARGETLFYLYDGLGRLSLVKDKDDNILKKYCYNYQGQVENCGVVDTKPQWVSTGETRCQPCSENGAYSSGIQEHKEVDRNPYSPGYNTAERWISDGPTTACASLPDWKPTGNVQCEVDFLINGTSYNTGYQSRQEQDMNPCSATPAGQRTQWVSNGQNCTACPTPANWQPVTSYVCEKDASGNNTGYQTRTEKDMEPCSATYEDTRTSRVYNPTACPLPYVCSTSNCSGNNQKCINNVCETGTPRVISSVYKKVLVNGLMQYRWVCTWRYCFSNGTASTYTYETYQTSSCTVQSICPMTAIEL